MTPAALRAALDAARYTDAEIRGSLVIVIVRDADDTKNYREHRDALNAAGIPVNWGGVNMPRYYWFSVKLVEEVDETLTD